MSFSRRVLHRTPPPARSEASSPTRRDTCWRPLLSCGGRHTRASVIWFVSVYVVVTADRHGSNLLHGSRVGPGHRATRVPQEWVSDGQLGSLLITIDRRSRPRPGHHCRVPKLLTKNQVLGERIHSRSEPTAQDPPGLHQLLHQRLRTTMNVLGPGPQDEARPWTTSR
jgi:hypothetical protein